VSGSRWRWHIGTDSRQYNGSAMLSPADQSAVSALSRNMQAVLYRQAQSLHMVAGKPRDPAPAGCQDPELVLFGASFERN
jgi:hypothetical protein